MTECCLINIAARSLWQYEVPIGACALACGTKSQINQMGKESDDALYVSIHGSIY